MLSQVISQAVAVVTAIMKWFLWVFNPRHDLQFAHPSRPPPDPSLFPRYLQNKQGIWLHWAEWATKKAPIGVVFLVGGLGEHSARYDSIALLLCSQGYYVCSLDHQGQGGSEGERCYVERFQDYVDDMQLFVKKIMQKPELSNLNRFLIGHSMGGLISVHLAMRDPLFWSGVVLSAPALEADPKVATPFMKSAARLLSELVPKLGLDKLDLNTLSKNRAVVEFAYQDPCYPASRMKARWASEMLLAMDAVWTQLPQVTFPFLIVHSSEDRICSISGSRKLFQLAPSKDKRLKEYTDMYHELFTELNRHEVLNEVQRFLTERCR